MQVANKIAELQLAEKEREIQKSNKELNDKINKQEKRE